MENHLRKRLARIKERAKRLEHARRPPVDGAAADEAVVGAATDGSAAGGSATGGVDYRRDTAAARRGFVNDPPCTLAEAATGVEHRVENEYFYRVRIEDADIACDAADVASRFAKIPEREVWPLPSLVREPGPGMANRIAARQLMFLDIETTGLSPNTYLFLIGLMYMDGDRFVVEQLFARDYSEETGVLLYLRDMIKRYPMLVTYNGASFDVPFIQTRMAVARVEDIRPGEHVDLLDSAQYHFRKTLPNCRLETIERHLRGFERTGDIPGWAIPEAYHEFVRTDDASRIKRILYHNRMDLLAMAYIINHLAVVV